MNKKTNWYGIGQGDVFYLEGRMIFRVPGGWIWESSKGVCFIPFNIEFLAGELNE